MEIDDASLIISDQILFNKIIKDKKFQENNKFSIKYEKFLLKIMAAIGMKLNLKIANYRQIYFSILVGN